MDALSQIQQLVAQGYSPTAAAALVSRQSGVSAAQPSSGNDVDAAINATATKAGMDPASWRAIAHIESGLKPGSNYGNPSTQYKGLFQIGRDEWKNNGSGNIYDPADNAQAAANIAAQNNSWFANKYGRAPSPIETYMMHQQGRGFYQSGTMTNIAGNTPKGQPIAKTPQEYEAMWGKILADKANQPYDPNAPTVASSSGGGSGGGGGVPSGAVASAAGGTAPTGTDASTDTEGGGGSDFASAMKGIADKIAKSDQANQPPPLPPLQIVQPMMTPAMIRARQYAQAMLNQPLNTGGTPNQPPDTGSIT